MPCYSSSSGTQGKTVSTPSQNKAVTFLYAWNTKRHWRRPLFFGYRFVLFILKAQLQRETRMMGKHRAFFHWLVQSPNGCNSRGWTGMKPGARRLLLLGLACGYQGTNTWAIHCCFPSLVSEESWIRIGAAGFELVPIWVTDIAGNGFTVYAPGSSSRPSE